MKNVTLALLAFCSLGLAQTQPGIRLPPNVRMYEPKNLTPDRAERVALFVQNTIGVRVTWANVPHAFVINGKPEDQEMVEALLKRYDVPPPRIELTVYVIRGLASAPAAAGPPTNPVPPEIKSAIDEMKATFNYQHYALWDAITIPIKTNGEVQGLLPKLLDNGPSVYTIGYSTGGPPNEGTTLNLAEFRFAIKFGEIDSHIKTDLTIREGQKLVLGKIRLLNDIDLFLVLTTKVY